VSGSSGRTSHDLSVKHAASSFAAPIRIGVCLAILVGLLALTGESRWRGARTRGDWTNEDVDRVVQSVLAPSDADCAESRRHIEAIRATWASMDDGTAAESDRFGGPRVEDWRRLDDAVTSNARVRALLELAPRIHWGGEEGVAAFGISPTSRLQIAAARAIDAGTQPELACDAYAAVAQAAGDVRVSLALDERALTMSLSEERRQSIRIALIAEHRELRNFDRAVELIFLEWAWCEAQSRGSDREVSKSSDPRSQLFRLSCDLYEIEHERGRHAAAWSWYQRALEFERFAFFGCGIAFGEWQERKRRDGAKLRTMAELHP
jgi:hypothetical protein